MLKTKIQVISLLDKVTLKDINVSVKTGTVNILEGANGSGKSTIARAIMGFYNIKVAGSIFLDDEDISQLPMNERASKGLFISHQAPTPISGVKIGPFLRAIYLQAEYIKKKVDLLTFRNKIKEYATILDLPDDIIEREINVGFSGGEMKKLEFLQLVLLKPKYAILDELDSGLDTQSRKKIFALIKDLANEGMGFLVITHREDIEKELPIANKYRLDKGNLINE